MALKSKRSDLKRIKRKYGVRLNRKRKHKEDDSWTPAPGAGVLKEAEWEKYEDDGSDVEAGRGVDQHEIKVSEE